MVAWYVYILYESPAVAPFHCKVGYTTDPLRRLRQLQAGNPRSLRSPDYPRKPSDVFGARVESKQQAMDLEQRIHAKLEYLGFRLRGDFDYVSQTAPKREWFQGIHPDELWKIVVEELAIVLNSTDSRRT